MKTNALSLALPLVVACAVTGASPRPGTETRVQPASTASVDKSSPSTQRAQAPLRIELTGSEQDGRIELAATVVAVGRLPSPPVITLELPPGAKLVFGALREILPAMEAGTRIERRFSVEGAREGFLVAVDAHSAAAGAHAEARWPEVVVPQKTAPVMVPIVPVQVHGVRIDQAIPVVPTPAANPGTTHP